MNYIVLYVINISMELKEGQLVKVQRSGVIKELDGNNAIVDFGTVKDIVINNQSIDVDLLVPVLSQDQNTYTFGEVISVRPNKRHWKDVIYVGRDEATGKVLCVSPEAYENCIAGKQTFIVAYDNHQKKTARPRFTKKYIAGKLGLKDDAFDIED